MKIIYIKPIIKVSDLFEEMPMMSGSTYATVKDENGNFDPITGKVISTDEDIPSTAKQGDFFEEPITSSSLWGDEE